MPINTNIFFCLIKYFYNFEQNGANIFVFGQIWSSLVVYKQITNDKLKRFSLNFCSCANRHVAPLNLRKHQCNSSFLLPEDSIDLYHPRLSGHDSAGDWVLQGVCRQHEQHTSASREWREVAICFSSRTPCERWWVPENLIRLKYQLYNNVPIIGDLGLE